MRLHVVSAVAAGLCAALPQVAAAQDSNACPVDGCIVTIASVEQDGEELKVTFDANFAPDMSKNHIHVWWGENYTVEQVSNNAEPTYGVAQGDWHPTADFPEYVTTGAASVGVRGEAVTLCVTAADRNHDILDPAITDCRSVGDMLP